MSTSWEQFLQLLWPNGNDLPQPDLSYQPGTFQNTTYLTPYQSPATKTLIKANKYRGDRQAARALATLLDTHLQSISQDFIIIPMPTSYKRWRERGYNHIELIVSYSNYCSALRTNILKKSIHTQQQTQVSKHLRTTQQVDTFTYTPNELRSIPNIVILLDDVITTGGTMQAARNILTPHLPADATLICLAIAH